MLVSPHAVTDRKVLHFCSGTGRWIAFTSGRGGASVLGFVLRHSKSHSNTISCGSDQNGYSQTNSLRAGVWRCPKEKLYPFDYTHALLHPACAGRTPKLTSLIQSVTYHAASMLLWVTIQDIQHQPKTDRTASVRPSTDWPTHWVRSRLVTEWLKRQSWRY